jgi:hypothetical protein
MSAEIAHVEKCGYEIKVTVRFIRLEGWARTIYGRLR